MRRRRFRRLWAWFRLWLLFRELKRVPRVVPPLFALFMCSCTGAARMARFDDALVVVMRDGRPACSGFAIDTDRVMTAAHCVDGADVSAVVTAQQWLTEARSSSPVSIVFLDLDHDVAVVTGEFDFRRTVLLRAPRAFETVFARSLLFEKGSRGQVLEGAGAFRDTTMSVQPGWSGSPVFAIDGYVVGFVDACRESFKAPGVCVPRSAMIGVMP